MVGVSASVLAERLREEHRPVPYLVEPEVSQDYCHACEYSVWPCPTEKIIREAGL